MIKKGLILLLPLVLLLIFVGCGEKAQGETQVTQESPVESVASENTTSPLDQGETNISTEDTTSKGPSESSLLSSEPAPNEAEQRIAKLKQIVEEFIKAESYSFEYNEERKAFFGNFSMESTAMKECSVGIYLYEDMVAVNCEPLDWTVPEASRDKISTFITLMNYDSHYAFLLMDYRDGYLSSFCSHVVEKALPTKEEIDTVVHMTIFALEESAEALQEIVRNGVDPHEAYNQLKEKKEE